MTEATIAVVDSKALLSLFGPRDQHLKQIRDTLGVRISARSDEIRIEGEEEAVSKATGVLEQLQSLAVRQGVVAPGDVARALAVATGGPALEEPPTIEVFQAGRKIQPRTPGQADYLRAIQDHDLVFCVGPAGTGKTYLAVAMAVAALKQERIRKIVLVRPAVEAGESLGYLPGDLQAKINPYLRPLLDALREMMDYDQIKRYTEQDLIEVIPLAYMRGRTLNDAAIILDEGQNSTVPQMKMFLTRMGHNARIVVTGDVTQVDLPPATPSGLADAVERLREVPGVGTVTLGKADIVRHPLVQAIVNAYEATEPGQEGDQRRAPRGGAWPPSRRSPADVGRAHLGAGRALAPLTARHRDPSMSFGKRRPKLPRAQLRPSNPIALQQGRLARQRDRLARFAVAA
ncbi:MAG TPA: PhoH family protein, partial [Pirellulales bacterium]|nr:PhoH family protein [Pirellulales bacterium]